MHELINIKNEEAVTTSLLVAEAFEKQHSKVIRSIENFNGAKIGLVDNDTKNGVVDNDLKNELVKNMFHKSTYTDAKGEKRPMYYINRDGFSLLVMSFTGAKALKWKLKYIEAFNQMESYINFRKADKQIQKHSMQFLQDNLQMPTTKDYMKANTIANKCVSTMFGYPKMVKKNDMSPAMLEAREPVLKDTVELMAVKDKYDLDIPVSESIYHKYESEVMVWGNQ